MSEVWVQGVGAASPAGWGMGAFRQAIEEGKPLAVQELERPGWSRPLRVRRVPPAASRPAFLGHPRLRRASPITHHAVAAALEALGEDAERIKAGERRLGIILCVMSGCVNYSRRFYDETLRDPATASPLVFPETVFNAPASHLGALLGTTAVNYTLVGDPGSFLQGLVVAADWLSAGWVDGCVVIGAEELDWLTADAFRLFTRCMVVGEGAGALYLRAGDRPGQESAEVRLSAVSGAWLFTNRADRADAVRAAASEARAWAQDSGTLVCDGVQGVPWLDEPERESWRDWTGPRLSPRRVLGEGLMASAAWQCVAAADWLARGRHRRAVVQVSGINEHVMWAGFEQGSSGKV